MCNEAKPRYCAQFEQVHPRRFGESATAAFDPQIFNHSLFGANLFRVMSDKIWRHTFPKPCMCEQRIVL